ncbi:MAG: S8 family serine peptidase [Acidobacteria bacterium]|nr:S8 family serine peptidase [Acidobacteriota bacterium]
MRVFDRTLTTTGLALVAAIEWAALQGVHLINLSLGASNQEHAPALAAAVAKAAARGAIVVSAAPQEGAAWLPGGLHGVVAVDVDWDCPREECRVVSADAGGIRLTASGYPRPIPGVAPERNFSGLSFAVANVTGLLALTLEDRPAQTVAALADRLRD